MVAGKRKNGFYLWTVRLLVFMLVFGQFGVYGGNRAHAAVGSGIVSSSNDYQYVMTNNNGQLEVNQKSVKLSWARSYNISSTGYSFTRMQSILGFTSDITNISFGSYTSKYAGQIDNAFLIDLSKVREIATEMTYRQPYNQVGQWEITHYNVLGQLTPIDVYDYDVRQLSLVVNADTGEVVDFYSELNPYYTRKAEPASFTKQEVNPLPINNVPSVPSNITGNSSENTTHIRWDHAEEAVQYEIERDGMVMGPYYGTSLDDAVLIPNQNYSYKIRAINSIGKSEWSSVFIIKTLLNEPVISTSSEQGKNIIEWAAINHAVGYQLQIDGEVSIDLGNVTNYEHVGLEANSSHTYALKAVSSDNESNWSRTATQLVVPDSASGLKITENTFNKISLSWTAIKGSSGYDLEVDGIVVPVSGTTYSKTALTPNTEHTFRLRSKNAGGVGKWTDMLTVSTLLSTPVLKAISSQEEMIVAWPAIEGATSYEVEADGVNVGIVVDPAYTHTDLSPGTLHKYRVRALNDTNTSAWTAILSQSTLPGPVSNLTINSVTNTAIGLKWTAVTGATGYDLEIDGAIVPVTGVAYTKSNLAANTEHTFRIRSKNAAGVGDWSDPLSTTTLLNTPVLKAASEETSIKLTWADVPDAITYEIEADGTVMKTSSELTFVHSDLLPGTAHKYRIRALTENNTSAWTTILTQSTIPASVTGLNISSATNVAIALKWIAVTGATGYDLEIDGTVVPVTGVAYTKSGLAANTDHTFRIRSKNAAGVGAWSDLISGTTLLNTPVLKATSEETAINLTWAAVADATTYEIEADGAVIATVSDPVYEHVDLLPGTAHKYRIRALTDINTSAWTTVLTQSTIPASVTGLNISSATNVAIALKWTAVTGATGYDIEIDGTVVPVTGVAYTKSGLAANTDHTFRIRSKNAAGVGAWSDLISGTTLLNTPVLKATSEETAINLTWAAVADATTYEVEADGAVIATVSDLAYSHIGLLPGTAHKYRIRALTDNNTSAWTAVLSQSTIPASVAGLNISSVTNVGITLKWTAVTGATGYDLEIDGTIVPVTGVAYTKSGLAANTEHTFRIRSKNAAGVGAWSDLISGMTLLNTPVLKATSEETAINLSWSDVEDMTAYEVEADGTIVGIVSEPVYIHDGLLPGTAHKYRIRALKGENTSAWTAVLTQSTIPAAVNGFMLNTATPVAISMKWSPVTGATAYDLEIDGVVISVSGSAYTKSGLLANTDHTFRIRAKNGAGMGSWSEIVTASTQLNVPTTLKGVPEETAVTLTWNEVAGATKYEIEADGIVVATVSDLMYVHNGVFGGTIHKYRIRALTDTNASAWTAILSQTTLPASVSGLSINSATTAAIALRWTAATGATGYDLEIDGTVVAVSGVAYTKSGLAPNTEHTFRIRAKNASGAGAWSESISGMTQLTTPVLKGTSDRTNVILTWDAVGGASSYEIEADGQIVATVSDATFTHSDLLPSSLHKYRIRAFNDQNTSVWSSALSIRTLN
ncbi:fibronectin type III domain-containing protein [Paenibacillus sp. 1781tsa1]|uniref:fibronectin type III domain-containing protein n=1 Tax=Paenibacillus sp. 1781tsa1 TaxID=2953810 RepID=UPI00209DAF05|nr:fibronectin type III domain-containing protein [Paenibacillus sp. 1781tsa1]MCP1186947.1 fibronectin type III domain-containing protein [Paenibacillus sp. 1781tsa1]